MKSVAINFRTNVYTEGFGSEHRGLYLIIVHGTTNYVMVTAYTHLLSEEIEVSSIAHELINRVLEERAR